MSEPIVFISHFRIKEGKLDGFKQLNRQVTEQIEASKPGTLVFLAYLNEDGTEVTFVHVFTDAEAMDRHNEGVGERSKVAFEFVELISREVYGMPSDQAMAIMRPTDGARFTLSLKPQKISGYIRFKPG